MRFSAVIASIDPEKDEEINGNISGCDFSNVVIVSGRNPSVQRNEGVGKAAGDIIYFLDDDSVPAGDNPEKAERIFESDENIAVIGGPAVTPKEDSLVQKVFGAVFGSLLASGKSRSRYRPVGKTRDSSEKEIILCNMMIKKSVFQELGGFRADLYPNEENEFLNRVKKNGYRIVYSPDIQVLRSSRKDFPSFFRQSFNYGRGRAEQVMVKMVPGDLVNFIPLFMLIYLASVPFVKFGFVWELPLDLYMALVVLFSALNAVSVKNAGAFLISVAAYPVLHISYGMGMLFGFLTKPFKRKRESEIELNIRMYEQEKE